MAVNVCSGAKLCLFLLIGFQMINFIRPLEVSLPGDVLITISTASYHHVSLGFRTCQFGEILSFASSDSQTLNLSLSQDGRLDIFGVFAGGTFVRDTLSGKGGSTFLNDRWHFLRVKSEENSIVVETENGTKEYHNVSLPANVSWVVGEGFSGCLSPGVTLNDVIDRYGLQPCHNDTNFICAPKCGNSLICQHGGRCRDFADGSAACRCQLGYYGQYCQNQVLESERCDLACQSGGTCMKIGSQPAKCVCPYRHTGALCEERLECMPNPCNNDGRCRPEDGSCDCSGTGFAGPTCNTPIAECESRPCSNGGRCLELPRLFDCACPNGTVGKFCETMLSPAPTCDPPCPEGLQCVQEGLCACPEGISFASDVLRCEDICTVTPDLCQNGGTCVMNGTEPSCTCPRGFSGSRCERNVAAMARSVTDPCATLPCLNGGNCTELPNGGYFCQCEPTWTGRNCETFDPSYINSVDACSSDPCLNQGSCVDEGGVGYRCLCSSGFTGQQCEIDVDECALDIPPCQNGGTCTNEEGGYSCQCPPGTLPPNCSTTSAACESSPCQHGGTCVPNEDSFYCECVEGFEGIYCENNKDDCFRVSCPEGKVCIDGINSYECGCPPGFTGDACTENINECVPVNPCAHNGTCLDEVGNFTCSCEAGWTGRLCEEDLNECESFDELCNQGICINEAGTYQCFCRPGFSGDHCDKEFDECLSYPCQNGATCVNEINAYHCHCAPGFTGQDCEFNIDECLSQPCQNGGSCVDGIASFNCSCVPGFTGLQCEVNIDECASDPCQNGGQCVDGIASFTCNCSDTGFEGEFCQDNIDECLTAECLNGGTCIDGIKDYECACHPAYSGKNCEVDIPECDSQPCANGGACYERSNVSLYSTNQFGYRFLVAFSYETAAGYACDCLPGFTGDNCEINIDECSSNPCLNGNCVDQVNAFFCECFRGYEGMLCQVEINECERFTPCVRGTCEDKIGDYVCSCPPNYGGKNCSVALTGCNGVTCSNGGSCFPYVKADEVTHGFTCVCPPGFTGFKCEIQTTVQFNNNGYLYLRTGVTSGYRLTMRFRTTLPNSLLAMSQGPNSAVFTLSLSEGRVHLNSSLLNMLEGIAVGESLNSGDWQECGLSFNASHATLSVASLGADGERQNVSQVVPINPNVEDTSSGVPQAPVFQLTVVGGKPRSFTYWAQSPSLIGCLQDINLNGDLFLPSELDGTVSGVSAGCDRQEQCEPNPCQNRGTCDDMWTSFQCQCPRPFLGRVCTKSFTEATFGHENTTSSLVSVRIPDRLRTILRTDLDISFFLRTREPDAFLLYIGTQLGNALFNDSSHLILRLDDGRLLARVQLSEVETKVFAHGDQLNTGHQQLIRVVRHNERLSISVNGSVLSNTSIPVTRPLEAEIMHLGNMPSSSRRVKRQVVSVSAPPLKGTLQDVRLGSDGEFFEVEFFGLDDDVRPPPDLTLLRRDVVTVVDVLRGSIQDNTCRHDPCVNGGSCRVKWWNDFECTCPELFHGKTCSLIKYCSLDNATTCPSDGECRDLITGGFECVTDATFVDQNTTLTYQLRGRPDDSEPEIRGRFRTKVGGPILSVGSDLVVEARRSGLRLRLASSETFPIPGNALDGQWHDFVIKLEYALSSTNRTLTYIHGSLDDPSDEAQPPRIGQSYAFNLTRSLAQTGGILQVGVAPIPESGSNYLVNQNDRSPSLAQHDVEIHGLTGHHNDVHYRGCIGELRIFDLLLPFFDSIEMGENQLEAEFLVQGPLPIRGQCRLCFDSECQHNSSCLSPLSSYNCSCQKGYEGQFCEIDIDECSLGHQCLNGDCVDGISTYTCACHPGFTGTRCETDINECESQPCQHGGSCIDQINDFKCSCTPDWEGHTCEDLKLKNCSQNPCLNNGRCQDIKYGSIAVNFTCVCSKAFTGRRCETQINFCDSYPCRNSAECIPRMGDFDCVCPLGYTGKQCEIDIDECASQPCHNGGTCSEGIDVFTCQCPPEWTGLTCSDDVDECLSDICENGGTCSNTEGGFNCECPEGYCGPHCSHYDPCLQNDLENQNNVSICLNEGECIPLCREEDPIQNATYLCNCTEGWEGEFCHIEATPSSQTFNKLVIIVAPILAAILVIAGISLMIFFIAMARKKRATRGTYSPSRQEIFGSRVEMGNVLKPPPEERLI